MIWTGRSSYVMALILKYRRSHRRGIINRKLRQGEGVASFGIFFVHLDVYKSVDCERMPTLSGAQ